MAQITVTRQAEGTFRVQTPGATSHDAVSVPAGIPASLGCGHVGAEELVSASFEFLLEGEPASSILPTFSLDVISQYFPNATDLTSFRVLSCVVVPAVLGCGELCPDLYRLCVSRRK